MTLGRLSGSTAEVVVNAAAAKPAVLDIVSKVWGARCSRRGLGESGAPA